MVEYRLDRSHHLHPFGATFFRHRAELASSPLTGQFTQASAHAAHLILDATTDQRARIQPPLHNECRNQTGTAQTQCLPSLGEYGVG